MPASESTIIEGYSLRVISIGPGFNDRGSLHRTQRGQGHYKENRANHDEESCMSIV
jgi:hypothetical protein